MLFPLIVSHGSFIAVRLITDRSRTRCQVGNHENTRRGAFHYSSGEGVRTRRIYILAVSWNYVAPRLPIPLITAAKLLHSTVVVAVCGKLLCSAAQNFQARNC